MKYLELLLEPVGFFALAWTGLVGYLWLRRAPGRKVALLIFLGFWFVASPLGANTLAWLLERQHPSRTEICTGFSPGDPVVVLGGGKRGVQQSVDEIEALNERTMVRTLAAWHLWQKLNEASPLLVTGGGLGPVKEADLMATLLQRLGVPEELLIIENRSDNTFDNARNVAPLLSELAAPRFFLVTSALHMPRAVSVFQALGLSVCPWPVDHQHFWPEPAGLWLPSIRPLRKSTAALHELQGLIWYGLGGRL